MAPDNPGYHLLRSRGPFLKCVSSWGSCSCQLRRRGLSKWLIPDFPPHFGRWRFKPVLIKSEKIKKFARHYAKLFTIHSLKQSSKYPYETTAFHTYLFYMRKLKFIKVPQLAQGDQLVNDRAWIQTEAAPTGITTCSHCLSLPGLIPQVLYFAGGLQAKAATLWTSSSGTNQL